MCSSLNFITPGTRLEHKGKTVMDDKLEALTQRAACKCRSLDLLEVNYTIPGTDAHTLLAIRDESKCHLSRPPHFNVQNSS